MSDTFFDAIDQLAGIQPGSLLDGLRRQRPDTRHHAQRSFEALFAPQDEADVTVSERLVLASFVAELHDNASAAAFYGERLGEVPGGASLIAAVRTEARRGREKGPYGAFPPGPLHAESRPGPVFRVSDFAASILGRRLAAGLDHAHLLVLRPREASPSDLQRLVDAGWSASGIVTLSQIVAFLSFQIRAAAGLRALAQARQTAHPVSQAQSL